ncbi:MAG: DUF2517 family protein [Aeromonas sp.]
MPFCRDGARFCCYLHRIWNNTSTKPVWLKMSERGERIFSLLPFAPFKKRGPRLPLIFVYWLPRQIQLSRASPVCTPVLPSLFVAGAACRRGQCFSLISLEAGEEGMNRVMWRFAWPSLFGRREQHPC